MYQGGVDWEYTSIHHNCLSQWGGVFIVSQRLCASENKKKAYFK